MISFEFIWCAGYLILVDNASIEVVQRKNWINFLHSFRYICQFIVDGSITFIRKNIFQWTSGLKYRIYLRSFDQMQKFMRHLKMLPKHSMRLLQDRLNQWAQLKILGMEVMVQARNLMMNKMNQPPQSTRKSLKKRTRNWMIWRYYYHLTI